MRNLVYKIVLSCFILIGFASFSMAQEKMNCDSNQPLTQKMCYQKLVSNLGEFIEYPDEAYFNDTEGRVLVRFTTNENKHIENVVVLKSPNQTLTKEVLRAIELMALEHDNHYISANKIYRIPIDFNLYQE